MLPERIGCMRTCHLLLIAAAMTVVSPQQSWATGGSPPRGARRSEAKWGTIARSWQLVCGAGSFVTCVSVSMRRRDIGGYTAIEMTVSNESGGGGSPGRNVFTAIGVANLPGPHAYPGWLTAKAPSRDATATATDDRVPGRMRVSLPAGDAPEDRGGRRAVEPGRIGVFTFSAHHIGNDDYNWQSGADDDGGPDGCSTNLSASKGGHPRPGDDHVDDDGDDDVESPDCECCGDAEHPITPVPEPATLTLFATGLLAVAGARVVRRRTRG